MAIVGGGAAGAAAAVADASDTDARVADLEEAAGDAEVVGCCLDLGHVYDFGPGRTLVFEFDFEVERWDTG